MSCHRYFRRGAEGERGAVLVFAAVGIVVAMLAAAMAIDVGSVIWRKRDLQVVADLAAADTAKQLAVAPSVTQAVADQLGKEAATRNNFNFAATGNSLTVVLGTYVAGRTPAAFVALPAADVALSNAVQVVAVRKVPFNFAPGSNTVTTKAVATFAQEPTAAFSIGSELANVNTNPPTVVNQVLSKFLGTSSAMNLSLLSYRGLGDATVSLEEIAAADTTLGTPDQLLAGDVNVKRLAQATATALATKGASGNTAATNASTILGTFAGTINSTLKVSLNDLIRVEQPGQAAAAKAQFNVFDLLTGSALAADGNNTISIPGLTLGIPGLTSADLKISVIEKPQFAAGPARFDSTVGQWVTRARTAQLKVELDTRIQVPPPCGFLCVPLLSVDLRLPIVANGAQATGSLTDIRCGVPVQTSDIDILAETYGAGATVPPNAATADAQLSAKLLGVPVVGLPRIINANVPLIEGSETLTFPGPHDGSDLRSTGANGLGLASLLAADLDLLGLINVGTFLTLVQPVTDAIDDLILDPIFEALGVSLSRADVRTHAVECGDGSARLVE